MNSNGFQDTKITGKIDSAETAGHCLGAVATTCLNFLTKSNVNFFSKQRSISQSAKNFNFFRRNVTEVHRVHHQKGVAAVITFKYMRISKYTTGNSPWQLLQFLM
jgi:hypothetical protein